MKYPSLFLIINIFAISIILSSADDSNGSDVREVHSTAVITIKDSKKPPEEASLPGEIELTDNDGNKILEAEDGSLIQFNIKVKADQDYKNGRVKQCVMHEKENVENKKVLCTECSPGDFNSLLNWVPEKRAFEANLKIMKLPDSKSNEVTIECDAIVCKDLCPDFSCPESDSRRKRRGILKKPFSFFLRASKTG